ncbi:MAG: hypothetical protein GX318_04540 [Clostridia bacterium]|nr:hypothetical protein [Clostridia bacterium]
MVLYTSVPPYQKEETPTRQFREEKIQNVTLILELSQNGSGQVVQVISSDPQDYLNPQFQPGAAIKYSATQRTRS